MEQGKQTDFTVRIMRHGHAEENTDDTARVLSATGKNQVEQSARANFPANITPTLLLTSKKKRAIQSMDILLQTMNLTHLRSDVIELHGLDYSWPMADSRADSFFFGPEHDNVLRMEKLASQFPEIVLRMRGMLMGSLMTAIQLRTPFHLPFGAAPEIWMTSHSPFGEFLTPDMAATTRRPLAGGLKFTLSFSRDERVTTSGLSLF